MHPSCMSGRIQIGHIIKNSNTQRRLRLRPTVSLLTPCRSLKHASMFKTTDNETIDWLTDESQVERGIQVLSGCVTESRRQNYDAVLNKRCNNVRFVFDSITNPDNVWASLRSMDGFGVHHADIIPGRVTVENRKRFCRSMGTGKYMNVTSHADAESCILHLKSQGYSIWATDLYEDYNEQQQQDVDQGGLNRRECESLDDILKNARDMTDCVANCKVAFVFGNEKNGISNQVRQMCDKRFKLDMFGFAQSFNLSVTVAIVSALLRHNSWMKPCMMSSEEKQRILMTWLVKHVKNSHCILKTNGVHVCSPQDEYKQYKDKREEDNEPESYQSGFQ